MVLFRLRRVLPKSRCRRKRPKLFLAAMLMAFTINTARASQDLLVPDTAIHGRTLTFNWPAVQIGIGSYEDGPTGMTVFRFPNRVSAAVDVRGGAPGTVNTDILRLGYEGPFMDAIVLAGGSTPGEESITSVMGALMDAGTHNGGWDTLPTVAGAIIYDYRDHRLSDIYPDKRLALAALNDLRPGVFPLGAQGAGRAAGQGSLFDCAAHSGQGGAFRQIGEIKIAAFTVVNALGVVTDRAGHIVKCHRDPAWGEVVTTSDLLARVSAHAERPSNGPTTHTTISLVMTNQRMSFASLQRLAVQVHTSMGRGLQPFSTAEDGDTLFAVSTQEVTGHEASLPLESLYLAASEAMWDAILSSVPEEPAFDPPSGVTVGPETLRALTGSYRFGPNAVVSVSIQDGHPTLRLIGQQYLDLGPEPVPLTATSASEFYVDSRYRTRISFAIGPDGRASAATINPGRWGMRGSRMAD
jgi:L-aminopeptidase/D-esterase-like protein